MRRVSPLWWLAVVIGLALIMLELFPLRPTPREVTWQGGVYVRSDEVVRLKGDLAASLQPVKIEEWSFWVTAGESNPAQPPLTLYLDLGKNKGQIYSWDHSACEDELLVRKPNIYFYSEAPQPFVLRLKLSGELVCSEPTYPPNGWSGVAYADGMIDRTMPYLVYEFKARTMLSRQQGWCIERQSFGVWCEQQLPALGLNERERADFAAYWSDLLPASRYLCLYLQPPEVFEGLSHLEVTPVPDASLRLLFYIVPSEHAEAVARPTSTPFQRQGFTLVEWGGILAEFR